MLNYKRYKNIKYSVVTITYIKWL